jgi:SAM-dependent methyltransferase
MASDQSFGDFELAGWQDETTAAEYDRHLSLVTTQSAEALLDDAGVSSGQKVLDIATGAGYVAAAAARRGAHPLGIDFSATQVRLARQRYPIIRFEQADAEALPFEPESFEAVVNAFGLCHLPNPDLALREAFRVLKSGGRVAFSVWDLPERVVGFGSVYAAIRAHGVACRSPSCKPERTRRGRAGLGRRSRTPPIRGGSWPRHACAAGASDPARSASALVRVSLAPEAEQELVEGALFYARETNAQLGHAFISEFEHSAALLLEQPRLGAVWRGKVRRLPLRRFPYSIVYHLSRP